MFICLFLITIEHTNIIIIIIIERDILQQSFYNTVQINFQ